MDNAKLVPLLVGLLIAVVMVGAVFVPVVQSSTSRTVTTVVENDGAEWLKLGYNEGTDYTFTVGFDGEDNFTVGTQTGAYKDLICYADNERTLFVSGDNWYLLTNGENPSVHKFTENASVTNASGTLTITDGTDTVYTGASPTWAYVPDANGVYGFFSEGGLNLEEGKPTVAVGSYAGVFAYNDTVVGPQGFTDFGLVKTGDYSSGEVVWVVAPSELDTLSALPNDTLEPAVIQPIDLGGSGSVGLMSVVPGTYTDGSFTFNIIDGTACIMSCTDTGIDHLVIPSTVSADGVTYTVTRIGNEDEIVSDSQLNPGCTLTIPDTVTRLGYKSFANCHNLGGEIVLPSGLTTMDGLNFSNCNNITGSIVIPSGVTQLPIRGYQTTSSIDGTIILPASVNTLPTQIFSQCGAKGLVLLGDITSGQSTSFSSSGIKEILNLGNSAITTTSYGLNADSVQDKIDALGYIAPTSITETEVAPIDSPVAGLMQMLPLIAGIGALFLAVGTMIYTRF